MNKVYYKWRMNYGASYNPYTVAELLKVSYMVTNFTVL